MFFLGPPRESIVIAIQIVPPVGVSVPHWERESRSLVPAEERDELSDLTAEIVQICMTVPGMLAVVSHADVDPAHS